ncbi:MAG TPA: fenitrothion hydrolase, partial [Solirubrobacterales bacterium]|nr:fenitrothion hydrolase [Solirubrobacterales bacterium]
GVTATPRHDSYAAFVLAAVGTDIFDGLLASDLWAARETAASQRLTDMGVDPLAAGLLVATIGLAVTVVAVTAAYRLVCRVSELVGGWGDLGHRRGTAAAFVHALVPIVLAYAVAHYFPLFVFQAQDVVRLASDPLGRGADLFGTADRPIDFQVVSANAIWTVQVGAIVIGHVLGLVLAHDRALELSGWPRRALRSQVAVLALMVALTVGGLWSLSAGMATI